jgi:hemolysin activation/secretion protein
MEYLLRRDQKSKLYFKSSLNLKETQNNTNEARMAANSKKYTNLELGPKYVYYGLGGIWSVYPHLKKGLKILDADKDAANRPRGTSKLQYTAYIMDVDYNASFGLAGAQFMYSNNIKAQYSKDNLPKGDSLSLGGASSIRGYHGKSFDGHKGIYSQNNLHLLLSNHKYKDSALSRFIGIVMPYVGYDLGHVRSQYEQVKQNAHSVAFGVKNQAGILQFNFYHAKALNPPKGTPKRHRSSSSFLVGLNFKV